MVGRPVGLIMLTGPDCSSTHILVSDGPTRVGTSRSHVETVPERKKER